MKAPASKTGPLGPECFENDLPDRTDEEIDALYPPEFNAEIEAEAMRTLDIAKALQAVPGRPQSSG
jgi:hypothetical protein